MKRTAELFIGSVALLYAGGYALAQNIAAPRAHPVIARTPPPESICWTCGKPQGEPAPNPPPHFDPLTASDAQLDLYGFPPRPDPQTAPDDYAFWRKVVTIPARRVQPRLQATNIKSGPARLLHAPSAVTGGASGQLSTNWSGYTIVDPNDPFKPAKTYVYGAFVVPVAQQAFGTCDGGWDWSFEWVGIDGWESNDVMQAGIEADAYCSGNTTSAYYSAWYEWYPYSETRISSPPIAPGDLVYVYVWNLSTTVGHYYMVNETQGVSSSLKFTAPSGTTLQGNSVEWIVERPGVNGSLSTLANYLDQPWYDARARTAAGVSYSPALAPTGSLYSLTMLDNSNNPISFGYTAPNNGLTYVDGSNTLHKLSGTGLWFFDEGSAH